MKYFACGCTLIPTGNEAAVAYGVLYELADSDGARLDRVEGVHMDGYTSDVIDATDGDGTLVTVRQSKTNQEGEVNDVRFVKDGVARALRTLRAATSPEPGDRVVPVVGADDRVTVHGGGAGRRYREPGHRALWTCRTGVGAHEPRRVDH